ncbi:acylamino-acid-releasing enzyme-like [Sycon ciliatum]|uniref:acylamino-acid-releasing enzyme-like n=1 Tax=Sycon ciliatum TaxID=27933 RepID=UPI0031F604B6
MNHGWPFEEEPSSFKSSARAAWLNATDYSSPTEGRVFLDGDNLTIRAQTSQSLYQSEDGLKVTSNVMFRTKLLGQQEITEPEVFFGGSNSSASSQCVIASFSPDNRYHAQITTSSDKKSEKADDKYHLVVTEVATQRATFIDLSAQKVHGAVCPAGQFGALSWSPDCRSLVYVADSKTPATKSYFPTSLDVKDDKDTVEGDENLYRSNWGEQLTKFHHTVLVVVRWMEGEQSVKILDNLPDTASSGQPVWRPVTDPTAGDSIAFVAWEEEHPRRGLIYCTQRPSDMYIHYLKTSTTVPIGRVKKSVRSPTFSPSGNTLVFLEQDARGPHHACSRLMLYDWSSKTTSICVDLVHSSPGNEFAGIFVWSALSSRCWSSCGQYIFFDTQWKSQQAIVCVNVATGELARLSPESEIGCWSVLDIVDNLVLATYSNPSTTPGLKILSVDCSSMESVRMSRKWLAITTPRQLAVDFRIVDLLPEDSHQAESEASQIPFQAIFICPQHTDEEAKRKAHPLVVFPHGGPHSAFVCSYSAMLAACAALGFYTVAVNYRGSSGFGQDNILSLLGKIGTNDVKDVQVAAQRAVDELPIDMSKIYVHGGSHGGFLAAHAIGQYPSFYQAACMRNPVIDLTSMLGITDIPDWVLVEGGWADEPEMPPNSQMMKQLVDCSPITYIDKVTAATLMLIGEQDARVPPCQGHRYVALLKHRNVKCRLQSYPSDCHPLSRVKTEADVFMNMMAWFKQTMTY